MKQRTRRKVNVLREVVFWSKLLGLLATLAWGWLLTAEARDLGARVAVLEAERQAQAEGAP